MGNCEKSEAGGLKVKVLGDLTKNYDFKAYRSSEMGEGKCYILCGLTSLPRSLSHFSASY